ncbi:NAD-dependent epimerase/dehydratase family protein [Streptomyces smyrnaeus]|uniref:NAD-dependent epimerase/dehydratase family protein n=1 Tax=Streptomyces smyrnaeus TaxID=1387713 RepID=UPI0037977DE2
MTGGPVLVLGGSGYLGRHICTAFTSVGATVVRVSRPASQDGPDAGGLSTVRLDLAAADTAELARLCADTGARVLVNASGAVWGGTEEEMAALNADLVDRLTDTVAGLPSPPRLIQLGSAYEYGPARHGQAIDENWPLDPATAYGRTKLRGSQTVLRAAAERGLDGVVLRVSVACGPGAPRAGLTGLVAAELAAGKEELRLAPLRAYRDLVDVRDVAQAVLATARAPARTVAGQVVNIGRGAAVPVRRLVDLLIGYSGRPLRVVEERTAAESRSDLPWLLLDVSRARRLLGWTPRRSLEDSLRDLLADAGGQGRDGR